MVTFGAILESAEDRCRGLHRSEVFNGVYKELGNKHRARRSGIQLTIGRGPEGPRPTQFLKKSPVRNFFSEGV
jgi:hypothetical protein